MKSKSLLRTIERKPRVVTPSVQTVVIFHTIRLLTKGERPEFLNLHRINKESDFPATIPPNSIIVVERALLHTVSNKYEVCHKNGNGSTRTSRPLMLAFDNEQTLNMHLGNLSRLGNMPRFKVVRKTTTKKRPVAQQTTSLQTKTLKISSITNILPTSELAPPKISEFWKTRVISLSRADKEKTTKRLVHEIMEEHKKEIQRAYPRSTGAVRVALTHRINALKTR